MSGSGKQLLAVWLKNKQRGSSCEPKEFPVKQLKNCALYHYRNKEGTMKSAMIVTIEKDFSEELAKLLLLLKGKQKIISHLETRVHAQTDVYIEIESKFLSEWNALQNLLESLNSIDIHPKKIKENFMGNSLENVVNAQIWFPRTIHEIDNFQHVLMYGTDLDADHPGFKDAKYRKRRKMFSEIALFYRHGDEIPRIKYTFEEKQTWKKIYNQLIHLYDLYACKEFKANWKELEKYCNYGPNEIPQLEDVNNFLKNKTGFQVRPVAGYLSPRDFLSGLAFRVFHCTQYIRHSSEPFYTPEPDCCHELLGHMPMLADKKFAQFSQEIGLASLGANDEDLKKLAACYFFTIEFGLCIEEGNLKIFGAGLLSSASEIEHVMKGIKNGTVCVQNFEVEEAVNTTCVVTSYQKRYFYTKSIEEAQNKLRELASSIEKPLKLRYNPYTQCIEQLEDSGKVLDIANELRGDLYLIQEAIKDAKDIKDKEMVEEFFGSLKAN